MPRTFFLNVPKLPIQNHGFWSIFLGNISFWGGWRFLESQKKLQASHVQLIQDEAGVWQAQLLVGHVRLAGKNHDTPAKNQEMSPEKWDHLKR